MNAAFDFEILFWILFLLAPVVSRWLKKRKAQGSTAKKGPQTLPRTERRLPDATPAARSERQLTPFEEALRQIQEALTEANQEREGGAVARQPRPPLFEPSFEHPAPPPRRVERARPPEPQHDRRTLFERQPQQPQPAPARRKKAKPAARDAFYDDAFEAEKEEPFHETVHTHVPSTPDDSEPGKKPAPVPRSKWEEAMVMMTVLEKPRSLDPWESRLQRRRRSHS